MQKEQTKITTLAQLRERRSDILRIAADHGAANVRVFGSVARGEAGDESDVDFLVDITSDAKGLDYFGLLDDLRCAMEELLGTEVDVVDSAGLQRIRQRVLREAVAL